MDKSTHQDLEIEVKFFIASEIIIQNKLVALGAISERRIFETNIRYEDQMQSLKAKQCLLRLRKDDGARLTVKLKTDHKMDEFKIMRELEVSVSDFDTMNQILNALGFHKAQIYEKWREYFSFQNTIICLDTLPFGSFLEIEGAKKDITAAAAALDLDWDLRILSNYLKIFEYIKQDRKLDFSDVTFSNFNNISIDFEHYRSTFEQYYHPVQ